jgi:hypothetical protein
VPDLWRQLVSFDDLDSLEAIRKRVTLELREAERASAALRELLADDRAALIELATLGTSSRVLHDLLVAFIDARTAELRTRPIEPTDNQPDDDAAG